MNTSVHALFMVGRISKGERRLVFVQPVATPPFPGPWELRAIFGK
jgi:hypothetical protein